MSELDRALRDFVRLFDRLGLPYAIMGGLAVRVYGIPRPTNDVDITLAIQREQLPELYLSRRQPIQIGETQAWLVSAEDLVLLKLLAGRPRDIADISDVLFTQGRLDEEYVSHWARELGVLEKLEDLLSAPPT